MVDNFTIFGTNKGDCWINSRGNEEEEYRSTEDCLGSDVHGQAAEALVINVRPERVIGKATCHGNSLPSKEV